VNKFLKIYILIFIPFLIYGCASLPVRPVDGPGQEGVYLKDFCDKNNIDLQWDSVSNVVTLEGNNLYARALVGSDMVIVGDERVKLSSRIKIEDSVIIVPLDFKKILERKAVPTKRIGRVPVKIDRRSYKYKKISKVVIDAGHGGKDPGATGRTGLKEKIVVLDIARRLKKILENQGIEVVMTRSKDKFITLQQRTEIASSSKSDLFVSVHANSSPARSVYGIEIYTLKQLGFLEKNEEQRKENYRKMYGSLSMNKKDKELQSIVTDMMDTNKQAESLELASRVANKMVRILKTKNRGLKKSRFFVLRNTIVPAVLVEVGFLSNPKEEKLLKTKAYRQKVANGLARGILEYAVN